MKYGLILIFTLAFSFSSFCQQHFGLLKFKVPASWQQQTRAEYESYTAPGPAIEGITEIIVYSMQPGAPKIDSSFRTEWSRLVELAGPGNAIPAARKRTTYSGLRYAENGAEVKHDNGMAYMQLMVFSINDKVQSIALFAKDLATFRRSREQIFDFMESIDSAVKMEQ